MTSSKVTDKGKIYGQIDNSDWLSVIGFSALKIIIDSSGPLFHTLNYISRARILIGRLVAIESLGDSNYLIPLLKIFTVSYYFIICIYIRKNIELTFFIKLFKRRCFAVSTNGHTDQSHNQSIRVKATRENRTLMQILFKEGEITSMQTISPINRCAMLTNDFGMNLL